MRRMMEVHKRETLLSCADVLSCMLQWAHGDKFACAADGLWQADIIRALQRDLEDA